MICETCENWKPKKAGEMAKYRFAPCLLGDSWDFKSPNFVCAKHSPVDEKTQQVRKQWIHSKT